MKHPSQFRLDRIPAGGRDENARVADLELLTEALGSELTESQRDAFTDMRDWLVGRKGSSLSQNQREWIMKVLDKPVYENLVSAGAVPAGRPVETIPLLKRENLPMKPPGRK